MMACRHLDGFIPNSSSRRGSDSRPHGRRPVSHASYIHTPQHWSNNRERLQEVMTSAPTHQIGYWQVVGEKYKHDLQTL